MFFLCAAAIGCSRFGYRQAYLSKQFTECCPQCLSGIVFEASGAPSKGARVVVETESEFRTVRQRTLPSSENLTDADATISDVVWARIETNDSGVFCAGPYPAERLLVRLIGQGHRPAALVLDPETRFMAVQLEPGVPKAGVF